MNLIKDKVFACYFRYLIPSLLSSVVTSIYSFVDTIAIGRGVGYLGTAALSIAMPIFAAISLLGLLAGIGGSVYISTARGAGKASEANNAFFVSLTITVLLTAAAWLLSYLFSRRIYALFGADDVLMPLVADYADWFVLALPVFVFSVYLACIVRTDENPNLVMIAVIVGGVCNVFGDWLLVFPLKMGMAGAAIASAAGSLVQCIILLCHFITKRCHIRLARIKDVSFLHASVRLACRIMRAGLSAGIIEIAFIVLTPLMNRQVLRYGGEIELAVFGVVLTCSSIFQHIFTGVGQSIQPLVSTAFGANLPSRITSSRRLAVITALLFGAVITATGALFPEKIIGIFLKTDSAMLRTAIYIVRVYFLSFLFMGISFVASYYLQSIMRTAASCVLVLLRCLVLPVALVFILPVYFGTDGIWWAMVATEAVSAVMAVAVIR